MLGIGLSSFGWFHRAEAEHANGVASLNQKPDNKAGQNLCFSYTDSLTEICTRCKAGSYDRCHSYYSRLFRCAEVDGFKIPDQFNQLCIPALHKIECAQVEDGWNWVPRSCPTQYDFTVFPERVFAENSFAKPTQPPQHNEKKVSTQPFTLPGWEDVIIEEPPSDLLVTDLGGTCRYSFKRERDPQRRWQNCKACRASDLPLPCIDVVLDDGKVSMFSATLPRSVDEREHVTSLLMKAWGKPSSRVRDSQVHIITWEQYRYTTILSSNVLNTIPIVLISKSGDAPVPKSTESQKSQR